MKNLLLLSVLLAYCSCGYCLAQDQSFYKKKNSWTETMIASRIEIDKQLNKIKGNAQLVLSNWFSVGPIEGKSDSSFSEAFAPEPKFGLKDEYENGKYRWTERPEWKDGVVNDFPEINNSAVYLQRTINYIKDTSVVFYFGSDDGLKVWLNGNPVFEDNANRACRINQDKVELNLKKGKNTLVIKINNNKGGAGFYFSTVESYPKDQLWKYVERDFTKPEEIKEIIWEKQDSIWNVELKEGNYSSLAKGYLEIVNEIYSGNKKKVEKESSNVKTIAKLLSIRKEYIKARLSEYQVLTPKPSNKPKINGAKVYGVRPGSPFLYKIAATGKRPMEFSVSNLPSGLQLDKNTGIITGTLNENGEYTVTLMARNSLGKTERKFSIICGDRIALTPPMGWNSWNCFADAVSDEKVRQAANAMVKSGLIDHGWTYINIDDFWENNPHSSNPALKGEARSKDGFINTNENFPDMKALSDYIHAKGLKMGIYSSPGPLTCGECYASFGFEDKDAQKYGQWGVDYLKYDWCTYETKAKDHSLAELMKPYNIMRTELNKINRDIVYSLCQYGMGNVWEWGDKVGGNCWRTTGDITDTWASLSSIGFSQAGHEKFAKPGNWNDPDMLIVGMVGWGSKLHPTKLTANEQYTHISLWCLLSSPLLIGCDMTQLDDFTLNLLTNDEVLAVNQDPLGKQASRISVNGNLEVWAKEMEDGSRAVGLFNRGNHKAGITTDFKSFGLHDKCLVRDLWRQKDLGKFVETFSAIVPAHGVKLIKVSALKEVTKK
ncbi:MAG: putative Ig domain-containing protein [Bacteroidota bacterium]|nr:putative Ig domain-containing protein [Bacteroidota bacterium]